VGAGGGVGHGKAAVLANGDVVIRAVATPQASIRQRFARVRGTANASQFKDMGTDEFMAFLRG
jgi:hypothetical protein